MRLLFSLCTLGVAFAATGANFTAGPTTIDLSPATKGFNISWNVSTGSDVACIVTWTANADFLNPTNFWRKVFQGTPSGGWSGKWTADGTLQHTMISTETWSTFQWGRTYSIYCATTPTGTKTYTDAARDTNLAGVSTVTKTVGCACVAANTADNGATCAVPGDGNWPQCWCRKAYTGYDCSEVIKPLTCARWNCHSAGGSCNTTGDYWQACYNKNIFDNNGACNLCYDDIANGNCTNNVCYAWTTLPPTLAPTQFPTAAPTYKTATYGQTCDWSTIDCTQGYCDGNGAGYTNSSDLVCREWRDTSDKCENDYQCASKSCNATTHVCNGMPSGGKCTSDGFHCARGFYCNDGTCAAETALGETCSYDLQCAGATFCAKTGDSTTAKCTNILSTAAGTKVVGADSFSLTATEFLCDSISYDADNNLCLPVIPMAQAALFGTPCKYNWECGPWGQCVCSAGAGQNNATCQVQLSKSRYGYGMALATARVKAGLYSVSAIKTAMLGSICAKGGLPFFINMMGGTRRDMVAQVQETIFTRPRRSSNRRSLDAEDLAWVKTTCFYLNHETLARQIVCEAIGQALMWSARYPCAGSSWTPDWSAADITAFNDMCKVSSVWGTTTAVDPATGQLPVAFTNKPRFTATASCTDGVKNGNEKDVDCGGSCSKCPPFAKCDASSDCRSGVCSGGWCSEGTTCSDNAKSGEETDVDCGGPCEGCLETKACSVDWDCAVGLWCKEKICTKVTSSCGNAVKDAGESDVDCGGNCPTCADGLMCTKASDCKSTCLTVFVGSSSSMICGVSASSALRPSLMVLALAFVCTLKSLFA